MATKIKPKTATLHCPKCKHAFDVNAGEVLRGIKSIARVETSQENGKLGGRPQVPLAELKKRRAALKKAVSLDKKGKAKLRLLERTIAERAE